MKKILLITLLFNIKHMFSQTCMGAATTLSTSAYPEAIVNSDFNGDGIVDLATANAGANEVYVFLGNGAGGFNVISSCTVGIYPLGITAADFNNDGKTDIATTNYNSKSISIISGDGFGYFATDTTINFPFPESPISLTSSDFNNDGNIDLAVTDYNIDSISILLGSGNGNFGPITHFNIIGAPAAKAISADFNNDGNFDLVFTNQSSGNLSVLMGTGTGSFSAAASYTVGTSPLELISDDFNGDSKLDLAVANVNSNNISVLLGIGNGSFGIATNFTVGTNPVSITNMDFNLDGKIDLITTNFNSGNVSVLLGTGSGSFAPAVNFTTTPSPGASITDDFNGDNKPDLAMVNDASNNVSILLNCSSTPTCIASVSDSLFQDVQPLTWNILPQYSPQVNNAKWYWGDGTYSNGLYPSHTYTAAGWYSICVTVYTSCGDSASTCRNDSVFRYANNSSSMIQVNVISSITTGTENMENTKNETILYPNPSNGKFIIEATHAVNQSIQIFDLNGKLVLTQHNDGKANIDASNLSEGIYNLIIKTNASIIHEKIIIVK